MSYPSSKVVYQRIINLKLRRHVENEIREEQYGFRENE
jgi:hypothetical protein